MNNSPKNILIVEDNMIISMVLERMITKFNHTVLDTIRAGRQAIEVATKRLPDLILMDIQLMDDVDGIDAMAQISKTADIPVIYITGNTEDYNRERAEKVGCHQYMTKPIQAGDLEEAISKAFTCDN